MTPLFRGRSTAVTLGCLAMLLAGAAALRSDRCASRWEGGHPGYNGAVYSTVARNHLRYGFLTTKFLSACPYREISMTGTRKKNRMPTDRCRPSHRIGA